MKLNFLFLPFVGTRTPGAAYLSHTSARYTRPAFKVSCENCLHSGRVEVRTYNYNKARNYYENTHLPRIQYQDICNIDLPYNNKRVFQKHPCKEFWEKHKLKKL